MDTGWTLAKPVKFLVRRLGMTVGIKTGTVEAAEVLVEEWKDVFRAGRGRTYTHTFYVDDSNNLRIGGPKPPHTASAPFEPPAPESGELKNSIGMEVRSDGVRVGSGLERAKWLEFGVGPGYDFGPHPAGITIAPRPHARPALKRATEEMTDEFKESVRTALNTSSLTRVPLASLN